MIDTIKGTLEQLISELELFTPFYNKPCEALRNATIGQHTRHIIELFQCLNEGYDLNTFSYDLRKRDKAIETNFGKAKEAVSEILKTLDRDDKLLVSSYLLGANKISINTTYYRELMYNLEHCIHHQALIKVAVELMTDKKLTDNFGVAPSTILYRTECVQ